MTVTEPLPVLTVLESVVGELESKSSEYAVVEFGAGDAVELAEDDFEPEVEHPATTGTIAAPAIPLRTVLRFTGVSFRIESEP